MNFKKIISLISAFVMCLAAAIPSSALTESSYNLDYQVTTDQFFNGFTDEIFKTTSWNSAKTDSAAVITSKAELQDYLSIFFESDIVQKYVKKYSNDFFKDNVLLINSLCQQYSTEPLLEIDNVTFVDRSVNVAANWIVSDIAEDVVSVLLVQVSIPKDEYKDYSVRWNISEKTNSVVLAAPIDENVNKKLINVSNIMQYPELPTGCEVVSLTTLLNHIGYKVDKLTLARNYLPKMDFYWSGGIYYGADFRTTFAGNPESKNSYGCYAPCITTTANKYLEENGSVSKAYDITGTNFDTLLSNYIDKDNPVLIWITSSNLHEPMLTSIWTTPEGKTVQWKAYEHCVVLTGYDMNNQLIYVSDPLVGNTSYNYGKIKQRYIDMGQQAVYIRTENGILIYGDIDDDGSITSSDSLLILRQSVGLENFNDVHKILADVDNDGNITSADALQVLRYSVNLPTKSSIGQVYKAN